LTAAKGSSIITEL